MNAATRQRFVITVEASDDADDPNGYRRLRMFLKRLLRSHRMRCITYRQIEPTEDEKTEARDHDG